MGNDSESVPRNKKKRVTKPKHFIDEVNVMVTVGGVKRRAKMTGITYELDSTKVAGVGKISWDKFTYTIGDDSDFLLYDDEIKANDRNIFVAIYKAIREKNNGKRADGLS